MSITKSWAQFLLSVSLCQKGFAGCVYLLHTYKIYDYWKCFVITSVQYSKVALLLSKTCLPMIKVKFKGFFFLSPSFLCKITVQSLPIKSDITGNVHIVLCCLDKMQSFEPWNAGSPFSFS